MVFYCSLTRDTILLTLGAHVQRGLRYLVCPSVCVCVCLDLQATRRFTSSTNGISATRARKCGGFCLTSAFESEKLALSWTTLRGPTH